MFRPRGLGGRFAPLMGTNVSACSIVSEQAGPMLVSIREGQIGPGPIPQPSTRTNQSITKRVERLFRFFRFVGKQGMAYLAELTEKTVFDPIV